MDTRPVLSRGDAISVDLIGPLPVSYNRHEYALVIMDEFTRNVEIYPLRSAKTRPVCARVVDYCCRYGFPLAVRSDNGPQFASRLWNAVCLALGIKPKKVVAYRPQGNPVERANRNVKQLIKNYAELHRDWDNHLNMVAFALRTADNESTGCSPASLTFAGHTRSPFDPPKDLGIQQGTLPLPNQDEYSQYAEELRQQMANIIEFARANSAAAKARQQEIYNRGRIPHNFKVGDTVWRRSHVLSNADAGVAKSLSRPFVGPFRIVSSKFTNNFDLVDMEGKPAGPSNSDQLRPCVPPPEWALVESVQSDEGVALVPELVGDESPVVPESGCEPISSDLDLTQQEQDADEEDLTPNLDLTLPPPDDPDDSEEVPPDSPAARPTRTARPPSWLRDYVVS